MRYATKQKTERTPDPVTLVQNLELALYNIIYVLFDDA